MDHLSIYESGIVNPYRNKNNDVGKSYFCPPNAAGSRKPIVSTRTLIVIVIVIVSIASYMLHLHISSESVLKGKTTTLRGYIKEKPISNLDPQIDKLKDSVHNVAESIVIEPVSIGLQQKNAQKINKILVKKAGNDSSTLNFAGSRLRGNYIPLAASSTVESTVIKTTVDNMNSRISEVDALSSKLSNIETNPQSTEENLSIATKGNGSESKEIRGGFNSTLFVVDQIPAALSPVVPSTIDTENLGATSIGIGLSRDESLTSKQGGNNNRIGVFIQADIIPSVSPTVALIASTMPTSPARLDLLVANTSALRVSTHGCAHGLSCNSSAISTKEPPSSSHNATTGLSTISTTESPPEIPTPYPTLAPTYSPSSSSPSMVTATSSIVDPQLASASNTTASPPFIYSRVNSITTTTLSPTTATTSSPTIATTNTTVPSPTIALNSTTSSPTIASQTTTILSPTIATTIASMTTTVSSPTIATTILSPTIALNTTATSTSTTTTESSPNIALNTTTSYPMIASQTTTTLSPTIAVSSPTIALNTNTSSPTIVSTTTVTVPSPTIAITIAAMTTTVSSPATALNTTRSSPTIAPTTTATVPSPTIAPNTTASSSTATLKNSASPLTANTITTISSPIINTTTSSLVSDSSSTILTTSSTMDSQSTTPSAATTTSPTIIDSHSAKAVTAVTTSKAGPLVVVVSNPIAAVEDAVKSDGQQQVPVVVEKKPFVIDMQEESVIRHPTIAPTATAAVVESEEQAEVEIRVQEHEVLAPAQSKMEELIERIKAPDMHSIDKLIDRQEDQDQQVIGDHSKVVTADSSKLDYCKGNVDPFEGQSIEHFKPPASASFDKAVAWKSAVKSMVESIGQLKIGGKELRLKMKSELERLRVLRFELFCAFA